MPMTPQQPMGLLGQLGIQKQDPLATDQTALPFYQRDRFKDSMGALAMAFNELRMNPSQAVPQAIMAGRENRAAEQQNNRTVEWLRSQPNGERFAQLAEAVGAGPALQMYQEAMKGPDQTAGQQNFAEYQRILATQGQEAADMFLKVAGNGGTSISLGGELSPEDKGRQQYNVERLGKLADIGGAQQALGQVQLLGQYLEAGGSGFGQGLAKFVKDTTGLDFQDAPSAAANALISQLIPAQRPQGSGSASDSDMRLFAAALPSMSTSIEGNRLIVQGMEALAQYKYDMALIAAEYMAGRVDASQADQAIIALGNPLENIMDQVKSFQSGSGNGGGTGGQPAPTAPAAGDVVDGYRFKGGDPADANNWEPI